MSFIINSNFILSANNIEESPPQKFNEVVFLGRSNVGKSSLLNSLSNKKDLAKISSRPGKTKLINFFDTIFKKDETLYNTIFIDMPGFGYAKVSKSEKEKWNKNLNHFINNREAIRLFIHIRDSRHINLEIDKNLENLLKNSLRKDKKVLTVFTKIDKLNQSSLSKLKKEYKNPILISNLNKKGINSLRKIIFDNLFDKEKLY